MTFGDKKYTVCNSIANVLTKVTYLNVNRLIINF